MQIKLRPDGRGADELRPVTITRKYTNAAPGSVLVEFGNTVVLCTASIEERLPPWLRDSRQGWVTAEYSMLPGSTITRSRRERQGAGGRTKEIERLIGRSLRAVVDLKMLGERQITLDCDVLQADGGTRTAAITGGYVALQDACSSLVKEKKVNENPISSACAAISVGIVNYLPVLDLPYEEDVNAAVDMNIVMTSEGKFVEVQGTAEQETFDRQELGELLDLAEKGCRELFTLQTKALSEN